MNKTNLKYTITYVILCVEYIENVSWDKNTNSSQYSIYLRAADPTLTTNNPSQKAKKKNG